MTRLVLSRAARADRDAIDEYTTERFGLRQAVRTREAFKAAFESLVRMPLSGRLQPDISPSGRWFRSRTVLGSFVIIYEPSADAIRVARILHGARHLQSELERESGDDP